MLPSFFNNTTIEIYEYVETDEYDKRGERKGEYQLKGTVTADIQAMTMKAQLEQFGKILQDTYKIFLPYTTDVEDTDILKIETDTYEILGTPEKWNHIIQYKQLTVQKQRKPIL